MLPEASLKKDAEKQRGQNTTLFSPIGDAEWIRDISAVQDLSHHPFMKVADDTNELFCTADLSQNLPQPFPVNSVKCLG